MKETGRCVWFDVRKGFGFIKPDSGTVDIFVHYSKILGEPGEFKVIQEDDLVEFETFVTERYGEQRLQAKEVRVIGGTSEILEEQRDNTFRGHGQSA